MCWFFVRPFVATTILFSFWPVLRFQNTMLFDWLAPLAAISALLCAPKERGAALGAFSFAICGLALMLLSGLLSMGASMEPMEHLIKALKLVFCMGAMVTLVYTVTNRKIFSFLEVLRLFCLSATISSLVCILQGKFGILSSLIPGTVGTIETWTRMTGLAEHPIEAGYVSVFGVLSGMGLVVAGKNRLVCSVLALINVYALVFSASLTALFALCFAVFVLGVSSRSYKLLSAVFLVVFLCGNIAFSAGYFERLTDRLQTLRETKGSYMTLQAREQQLGKAIEGIEFKTLFVGNGYSESDTPDNMEIHNGFIAAIYHFGFIGLLSQLFLISFFVLRLRYSGDLIKRSVLAAYVIVFFFAYLTGPPLSRRSLWFPLLFVAAYIETEKKKKSPPLPFNRRG